MPFTFNSSDKKFFPLKNVDDFVRFFKSHLSNGEPNLSLLSIVLGHVEDALTVSKSYEKELDSFADAEPLRLPTTPLEEIEALYNKFVSFVRGLVDMSSFSASKDTSKETIKRISDVIWSGLNGNYTDKAHLQSIFSYITGC